MTSTPETLLEISRLGEQASGPVAVGQAEAAYDELRARLDEVVAALSMLQAEGRAEDAVRLAGALGVVWQDAGRVDDGRRLTEDLLAACGADSSTEAQGRAWLVVGELAFRAGDQQGAVRHSDRARNLAATAGDPWTEGRAALNLARVAFRDSDPDRIRIHARQVLDIAAAMGSDRLRCGGLHMTGWAEYTAGDIDAALRCFEDNARLYAELGSPVSQASEHANVADLAMESGDLERAQENLAAALALPEAAASSYLAPSLVNSAGVLSGLRGDLEWALRLMVGAEALFASYGTVPDPGDELTPQMLDRAVADLGEGRCAEIRHEVAGWDSERLVQEARRLVR